MSNATKLNQRFNSTGSPDSQKAPRRVVMLERAYPGRDVAILLNMSARVQF